MKLGVKAFIVVVVVAVHVDIVVANVVVIIVGHRNLTLKVSPQSDQ